MNQDNETILLDREYYNALIADANELRALKKQMVIK
jgi:hypothetical protein